jgi:hypothetical protein
MRSHRLVDATSNIAVVGGWLLLVGMKAWGAESAVGRAAWLLVLVIVPMALWLAYRWSRKPFPYEAAASYPVSWSASEICVDTLPPLKESTATVPWSSVTAARFVARDLLSSDEVWVFAKSTRKPVLRVPTEAPGGQGLVGELAARNLLNAHEIVGTAG